MIVTTAMEQEHGTGLEIVQTLLLLAMDGVYFIVTLISCSIKSQWGIPQDFNLYTNIRNTCEAFSVV